MCISLAMPTMVLTRSPPELSICLPRASPSGYMPSAIALERITLLVLTGLRLQLLVGAPLVEVGLGEAAALQQLDAQRFEDVLGDHVVGGREGIHLRADRLAPGVAAAAGQRDLVQARRRDDARKALQPLEIDLALCVDELILLELRRPRARYGR